MPSHDRASEDIELVTSQAEEQDMPAADQGQEKKEEANAKKADKQDTGLCIIRFMLMPGDPLEIKADTRTGRVVLARPNSQSADEQGVRLLSDAITAVNKECAVLPRKLRDLRTNCE